MIKVISNKDEVVAKKYPKLIKGVTSDRIVLLVSKYSGYVLDKGNNEYYDIGQVIDVEGCNYSDYNEPVTIQNI